MSFNSLPFLIFILFFFLLWPFFKGKQNAKYLFLVASSFVFYGWWDWRFLFLIIFSGLVDFWAAKLIYDNPKRSKSFLVLSLVVNLGALAIFKYSTFVAEQIELLLQLFEITVDLKGQLPAFTYILPVGISFYTFQSMSYTIDVYRGKLKPTNNIFHFFSYLAMFPQLVAGPIVRAKDFLHQLSRERKVSSIEFLNGIKLIIIGYFQKTVLADNLGVLVDQAFAGVDNGVGIYWWVVMVCFAFQIYFDFNGYTQIARGLAKLMGYHFKMNFNHPYMAISLRDFWSRWHISLSTWFRDYVYIPLGGSRKGKIRLHINLWATMTLSGLWHGAQINFVLWGMYHGAILSFERVLTRYSPKLGSIAKLLNWGLTFILVLIGWVFFRATSFDQIFEVLRGMFTAVFDLRFIESYSNALVFLGLAILYETIYFLKARSAFLKGIYRNQIVSAILFAMLIASIVFLRGPEQEFIYFQF